MCGKPANFFLCLLDKVENRTWQTNPRKLGFLQMWYIQVQAWL